jgi:hypothetical protein
MGTAGLAVDVHQHLWPEELCRALAARRRRPRLRRRREGWTLEIRGEPAWPLDPAICDAEARRAENRAGGVGLAVVAPSLALGIEVLPADESAALLEAYDAGLAELGPGFAAWASVVWREVDPGALARHLDAGRVGLCLGARCLAAPADVERVAPLLELLVARDRPLFVHPGPTADPAEGWEPPWWPALTRYVADMSAAWYGVAAFVRPRFPGLRICFAMLAGLAPVHTERRESRGAGIGPDPLAWYDTSSYGPRACEAVIAATGAERLVHGSDRPMGPARPPSGDPALAALIGSHTPRRLLDDTEVPA